MKRVLLTSAAILTGYWAVFLWEQAPKESDSLLMAEFAPRQAAVPVSVPLARAPERTPSEAWAPNAEDIARHYIDGQRDIWNLQPHHELRPQLTEGPMGTHVRFQIYQNDYQILGMEIQMRVSRSHEVKDVMVQYRPLPEADLSEPMLSEEELVEAISPRFDPVSTNRNLFLYAPKGDEDAAPVPAIAMTVRPRPGNGKNGNETQAVFRASDGQVLDLTVPRAEFK